MGTAEAIMGLISFDKFQEFRKKKQGDAAPVRKPARRRKVADARGYEMTVDGNLIVTINGKNLLGDQELQQLRDAGLEADDLLTAALCCSGSNGYNERHRLRGGREYRIGLMPARKVFLHRKRVREHILRYADEKYDFAKPVAEAIFRLREVLTREMLTELDAHQVVALHHGLEAFDKRVMLALALDRRGIYTMVDDPEYVYSKDTAFAFFCR